MSTYRGSNRASIEFLVKAKPPKLELETMLGRVKIGPYREGDEAGILELFKEVFKVDRPLEKWVWEYKDHPVGMHVFVGRLADGKIVSHFSGLPVRTKVFDKTFIFSQIVDSMVHPRCRAGLKKQGLFKLTLLAYCYEYGREDRELVHVGLPNALHYRLGVQTLYYVPLTKCYAHTKTLPDKGPVTPRGPEVKAFGETFHVDVPERFPDDVGDIWEKVKATHGIIGHRDAEYLDWRYCRIPDQTYRIITVRSDEGALRGVAVTRTRWLGKEDLVIVDWLVDPEYDTSGPVLVGVCEYFARIDGMNRVLCILNHNAPESRVFEDMGYDLEKTGFRLVAHSYAPETLGELEIQRHWYYTLGDFDVV